MLAETIARQQAAGDPRRTAALAMANPGLDPGHPDIAEAAAYPGTIEMAVVILRGHGALPAGPE